MLTSLKTVKKKDLETKLLLGSFFLTNKFRTL